jgi:hypothetical protein
MSEVLLNQHVVRSLYLVHEQSHAPLFSSSPVTIRPTRSSKDNLVTDRAVALRIIEEEQVAQYSELWRRS